MGQSLVPHIPAPSNARVVQFDSIPLEAGSSSIQSTDVSFTPVSAPLASAPKSILKNANAVEPSPSIADANSGLKPACPNPLFDSSPLYIPGKIEDVPNLILVDTGSSLSLIDREFVQGNLHLSFQSRGRKPVIITANGQSLRILGHLDLQIELCDLIVVQQFWVVADLAPQCILGCDFLTKNPQGPFLVDVTDGKIVRGQSSPSPQNQVHVAEPICIPARSEVCLALKVDSLPFESSPVMIEPNRTLPNGLCLARTVSLPCKDRLFARIANFGNDAVQLFPGQTIGVTEQVQVLDHELSPADKSNFDFSQFDIDWESLDSSQLEKLKAFLATYRDLSQVMHLVARKK